MNERIRQLAEQAEFSENDLHIQGDNFQYFAELIVRECLDIAKNWDDQLINAKLVKESNAVGIVAYRIARQFGVEE
jgi:acid stress-induced BolA-like protein IbaG/YrbA